MGRIDHPSQTPEARSVAKRIAVLQKPWVELRKTGGPYFLISPFYFIFTVFFFYPILFSLYLSLTKWKGLGPIEFVGLLNYAILLKDKVFWQTMENSAILFFMHVPLMLLSALALAVLMNSPRLRGFQYFRLLIAMPYISNLVAAGITFRVLLDQKYGLINRFLAELGFLPVPWLESMWGGRISLCMLIIWAWLGYYTVILLAGLQTLPREVREAALVDGASQTYAFFYITVPMMRPVLAFCLILATINTFSLFTEAYILTYGGPINATLTPLLYIYRYAFQDYRLGYGSAASFVFFTVTLALALIQMRRFAQEEA